MMPGQTIRIRRLHTGIALGLRPRSTVKQHVISGAATCLVSIATTAAQSSVTSACLAHRQPNGVQCSRFSAHAMRIRAAYSGSYGNGTGLVEVWFAKSVRLVEG
jgi:hypothetical protein